MPIYFCCLIANFKLKIIKMKTSRREFLSDIGVKSLGFVALASGVYAPRSYAEDKNAPEKSDMPKITIPSDAIDAGFIYHLGKRENIWPRGIDYGAIVRQTPQHQEYLSVERGTGKSWILLSEATELALTSVKDYAEKYKLDFVAAIDPLFEYLRKREELKKYDDEQIKESADITEKVISSMTKRKTTKRKVSFKFGD